MEGLECGYLGCDSQSRHLIIHQVLVFFDHVIIAYTDLPSIRGRNLERKILILVSSLAYWSGSKLL
jgi:hypothetical protein